MSWKKHETIKGPDQFCEILLGAICTGRLTLRFRPGLVRRLGWDRGQRVDLLVGDGDDRRKMRVIANSVGSLTLHGRGRTINPRWGDTLRIAVKPPIGITRRAIAGRPVAFAIIDGGIEFTVPFEWYEAQARAA